MKKVFLSLALLAGVAGAAQAQVKYGVKGGFNASNLSGRDDDAVGEVEYKAGFNAGAFLNFGLSDKFSVQPELLYSQKGFSVDGAEYQSGTTIRNDGTSKSTFGYIDVPIMFRLNTGDEGKGFFVEAGPQGSLIIHQRSFTEDGSGKTIGSSENSTDDFNKVVVGLAGGIGYQITSGLGLSARYTTDLSNVFKNNVGGDVRNYVLQFQVGYAFGGE